MYMYVSNGCNVLQRDYIISGFRFPARTTRTFINSEVSAEEVCRARPNIYFLSTNRNPCPRIDHAPPVPPSLSLSLSSMKAPMSRVRILISRDNNESRRDINNRRLRNRTELRSPRSIERFYYLRKIDRRSQRIRNRRTYFYRGLLTSLRRKIGIRLVDTSQTRK